MTSPDSLSRNFLLNILPPDVVTRLREHHVRVQLKNRAIVEEAGMPIEHVFFVESGVVSIVGRLPGDRQLELGIIGNEGVTGTAIVQGDDRSPHEAFVQMEGAAIRIPADHFRDVLATSEDMRTVLHLYVRALGIQLSSTALANGRAKLEERLARWLLMIRDRSDSDRFSITHEFLALMLGVRRPGVTVALHLLEGKGLIRSRRGEIHVLDREGLIVLADGAYGVAESEYERLLGGFRPVPA